jgi:hypothetical protein
VVNTVTSIIHDGTYNLIGAPFYVSLMMVITGAVCVLVFAPRPETKGEPVKKPEPADKQERWKKPEPEKEPVIDVKTGLEKREEPATGGETKPQSKEDAPDTTAELETDMAPEETEDKE